MPRLKRETHKQHEQRFGLWFGETKGLRLTELAKEKSAMEERRLRIEFAASVGKPEAVTHHFSSAVSTPTTAMGDSAVDPLWRRRVLPLSEFAAEFKAGVKRDKEDLKRKYGLTVEPLPVPLLAGKTEEEYDQAFFATLDAHHHKPFQPTHMNHIRVRRLYFAHERARWWGQNDDQDVIALSAADLANCCVEKLPKAALYSVKYVTKESYQLQVRSGFFRRLKKMSRSEIYSVFGTVLLPVYVPLEENETVEKCEERFAKWLPVSAIVNDPNPLEEHTWRIRFAVESSRAELSKKHTNEQLTSTVEDGSAVVSMMSKKKKKKGASRVKYGGWGLNLRALCLRGLMSGEGSNSPTHGGQLALSCLEAKLLGEYEAINEQVVMNETVLEESEVELLAATHLTPAHETARLVEENADFRRLLEDEIDNRNVALAMLIVCMWREDVDKLKSMVSASSATDAVYIHRASHRKCATLSAEISERQSDADLLKTQLVSVTETHAGDQLQVDFVTATSEIQGLNNQRRREFLRLVRFDERVRLLVEELLGRLQ